ncbi:YigZ family protein [Gilvimarinus sp. SDUM040013]|uniref:YigZ family protein n=1 Tax=Gilvimarinus gilvus TaxID=3058038 RepID=A0ABU4RZ92_9GAMM|nr:YigZ family protein [Gilvimarinus sp. SDUM040013]MDO3386766.1 YigZ family protein [Gilvimarinus sp. SDUM040013]MDX6848304.1 YigZ family protein [Gilvimarinus sp. SDUM040013]
MSQSYQALAQPCQFLYEEKRSTFTAVLTPVQSREDALRVLKNIKQALPGASHYCWAYIVGNAAQPKLVAFSDDGEPSGTAGKPILNVLTHRSAGDCMAVVVRTFGGTKLGAGGLVRAYGASVSQALDNAQWREVVPQLSLVVEVPFAFEQKIRLALDGQGAVVDDVEYADGVSLYTTVAYSKYESLQDHIRLLTSGQARVRPLDDK